MLAHSKKLAVLIALGLVVGLVATTNAQQLPSQKYKPAPPSVHVPAQQARQLSSGQFRSSSMIPPQDGKQISLADYQAMAKAAQMNPNNSGYNFSDQGARNLGITAAAPTQSYYSQQSPSQPGFEPGTIQQTSYVDESNSATPQIPEILRRTELNSRRQVNSASPIKLQQNAPVAEAPSNQPQLPSVPQVSNDFPTQMEIAEIQAEISRRKNTQSSSVDNANYRELDARTPRFDPEAIQAQSRVTANELHQLRNRQQPSNDLEGSDVVQGTLVGATSPVALVPDEVTRPVAKQQQGLMLRAQPMDSSVDSVQTANYQESAVSGLIQQTSGQIEDDNPVSAVPPMVRNIGTDSLRSEPIKSTISMVTPSIKVDAFGPKSVGINKTAKYEVKVTNLGNMAADRILVGVDLPEWVDVQKVNLSNGTRELTDGVDQARLLWTIDRVPGNSSQTITIEAIPRKSEMFDLGVEWTFVPRTAVTAIEVTEPRLEMKISGPRDVQFGEKAIYHVTVRNAGTGTAENVTVMLPEALGGARAPLEDIPSGKEQNFQVELLARTAGDLDLTTTATADGDLTTTAKRLISVRRAKLEVAITGPSMKYAGSTGQYTITIANKGDATAADVAAAVALPAGVKYLGGVEAVKAVEEGLQWAIGALEPGDQRTYKINCELNASGDLAIEAGARGKGDLVAGNQVVTLVETVADLVLAVDDPRGPLPTGQDTIYSIRVKNRGSRVARNVNLVMQFSEGIEPKSAEGLSNRIVPGQVLFSPIESIEPGEEMTFKVMAHAIKAGTRVFRAQLTCADSDSREIAEGTTKFFGDDVASSETQETNTESDSESDSDATSFKPSTFDGQFRR